MSRLSPFLSHFSLQRVLAAVIFVPLLAYCFDPFRDMSLTFWARLVFWGGVIGLALAVTWGAGRVMHGRVWQSGAVLRDVTFVLMILCLFAPSLWLLAWLVFTFSGQQAPGPVAVIPYGLMMTTGLVLVRHREEAKPQEPEPCPRLHRRLPPDFDGEVFGLTVRDHYVDVATSAGVFTIRSRLTDAIAEMEPVPGHCTHRSHWVTAASIVGVERQGNRTFLKLRNDDLVPVSRKYRPQLEEAGVL